MRTLKRKIRSSNSREEIVRELERAGVQIVRVEQSGPNPISWSTRKASYNTFVGNRTRPLVIKY